MGLTIAKTSPPTVNYSKEKDLDQKGLGADEHQMRAERERERVWRG